MCGGRLWDRRGRGCAPPQKKPGATPVITVSVGPDGHVELHLVVDVVRLGFAKIPLDP